MPAASRRVRRARWTGSLASRTPGVSRPVGVPIDSPIDNRYVYGMRFVFLALVARGDTYGYELKRRYDAWFSSAWGEVNIGQIYVTMGRLQRDGLVTSQAVPQATRPQRKVFAITELGAKALEDWLHEPSELPSSKSDLLLRLVGTTLLDATPVRVLVAEHRQRCLEALRMLDGQVERAGRGSLTELLLQGSALHVQAELRWLDLLDQRLRGQALPLSDHGGVP